MAAPAPTVTDLQALIQMLQAQVATLQATIPAAPATGTAAAATFAVMLQTLNAKEFFDYLTKRGSRIYEQGCKALKNKALNNGFGMNTNQQRWEKVKLASNSVLELEQFLPTQAHLT
jgi:hypothetical protein